MKEYRLLFLISLLAFEAIAQDNQQVTLIYKNAIKLNENKETFKALAEFQKVLELDPNHKDALYNLGSINYQLGDNETAIRLFRKCVKLNDKKAVKFLRDQFHFEISYADTMQNVDITTSDKFTKIQKVNISGIRDLAKEIIPITSNRKEQLQMLLLWSYYNMKPDSIRFFNGGDPLTTEESIVERKGLCEEYSNIVDEFCKIASIESFKVTGYVKYPSYVIGDVFQEANHAWNAVYLDSSWVLCDLFWSTTALDAETSTQSHFVKRLETDYFLGHPSIFLNDHLPADPIFQFENHPIEINAFTKSLNVIDLTIKRMPYLNYKDSIEMLLKMSDEDQALRIANHSYRYNKNNPNQLITENFNYAVGVLNKKTSSKAELKKAKSCLTSALSIIDLSKNDEIKSLKENCRVGLSWIDKRLATSR